MNKIVIYIIYLLIIIFLLMNIKIRNEEIWKLRVENEDLKEQIDILKNEGGNKNENND